MTKSTKIHRNQQPQVTEIRVKPNQDARNDLGVHETQSEIQKSRPKRTFSEACCAAPECSSPLQSTTVQKWRATRSR